MSDKKKSAKNSCKGSQRLKSKDLVIRAIEFEGPSRIPLDIRSNPEESDIVLVEYRPPSQRQPDKKDKGEGEYEDEWGCLWENIIATGTQSGQIKQHPLTNWADFGEYQFPDPHAEGRFEDAKEKILKYEDRYILGTPGVSGFYKLFALRGFENLLTDIYLEPANLSQLVDKVFEFEREIIRQYSELGINGIALFDDWGTEGSLFIKPAKWQEIFKPRYKEQFELIHKLGMKVFFHSCGYIWDILEDLIEIGADVLNLEQPLVFGTEKVNGIDCLADKFGGKVCFECCADQQRTLGFGSKEEITQEARHLIQALGKYDGGFIALADGGGALGVVPEENIRTMMQTFKKYGRMA